MATPGVFTQFKGLWNRGHLEECPPDHFTACLNTEYIRARVSSRNGYREYRVDPNIVRMHLYKPSPPYTGTNVPRILGLTNIGQLKDLLLGVILHTDIKWTDFALVNFFGRCYISPHDGRVGIQGESVWMYDGTGIAGFRLAAGAIPTTVMTAALSATGSAKFEVGDYVLSYLYETASGFLTQPWAPFVKVSSFGGFRIDITSLPLGPAGTAARWIIMSKVIPFESAGGVGNPQLPGSAHLYPLFFAKRIADNTTTSTFVDQYDNDLIDTADIVFNTLTTIPAGVGLLDYKGRMITYGEYADPSLVRASQIGEPELFSATSGFLITDPSDDTGVRAAVEFRDILYLFKRTRGGMTQDNGDEISTWQFTNFEKSYGTEQYGIAAVLDAKGASSDGYIMGTLGALVYFNGTFVEPTLSYKIRDLWTSINETYFHLIQIANDPVNRRLYILVPLDDSGHLTHIIFGDYRDGLDPMNIKWSLWKFPVYPTSILVYTDFTAGIPNGVTRMSNLAKLVTLDTNHLYDQVGDDYTPIATSFELPPVRFSTGMSLFNLLRIRAMGNATLIFKAYGIDKVRTFLPAPLTITTDGPGEEFTRLMNLVTEECSLAISSSEPFALNALVIEGRPFWSERPR